MLDTHTFRSVRWLAVVGLMAGALGCAGGRPGGTPTTSISSSPADDLRSGRELLPTPAVAEKAAWQSIEVRGFSAAFPAAATKVTQKVPAPQGEVFLTALYAAWNGGTYAVIVADSPVAVTPEMMESPDFVRGVESSAGGKVQAQRTVTLDGRKARELDLVVAGRGTIRARVYATGGQIFQALCGPIDKVAESDAQRFFDSVKLPTP